MLTKKEIKKFITIYTKKMNEIKITDVNYNTLEILRDQYIALLYTKKRGTFMKIFNFKTRDEKIRSIFWILYFIIFIACMILIFN